MKKTYTDFQQLPIMLNAEDIARILRISRANAYVLMHSKTIRCLHIGKRMLLPKAELLRYIEENTDNTQNK